MTVTVRSKIPLTAPPSVRRRAGIKTGDRVEFRVSGGVISIVPKLPGAGEEDTPAQRRRIDARLAESEADLKRGRTHGPFATHEDMMAFLKDDLAKQRRPARSPRTPG
jgi:bifunctional DNA-binding transcriptional regulator/antitoxin component of YhaV-PrlF toxin-antitoxin module